jgi:hypothetical protein
VAEESLHLIDLPPVPDTGCKTLLRTMKGNSKKTQTHGEKSSPDRKLAQNVKDAIAARHVYGTLRDRRYFSGTVRRDYQKTHAEELNARRFLLGPRCRLLTMHDRFRVFNREATKPRGGCLA